MMISMLVFFSFSVICDFKGSKAFKTWVEHSLHQYTAEHSGIVAPVVALGSNDL